MSIRLIVNADDYGHTPGVSAGIRRAHLEGIVTTATVMMNHADAVPALRLAREECPALGIGVHLIMTEGRPVLPPERVPTLVKDDGAFHPLSDLYVAAEQLDIDQLRDEWRAQIEKFLSTGMILDHLDSHHHAAFAIEKGMQVLYELAEAYRVPARHPYSVYALYMENGTPDPVQVARVRAYADPLMASGRVVYPERVDCTFYNETVSVETMLTILDCLPENSTTEMMVHPGLVDDEIMRTSSYNAMRARELEVLTDPRVRAKVRERGIELITFAQL